VGVTSKSSPVRFGVTHPDDSTSCSRTRRSPSSRAVRRQSSTRPGQAEKTSDGAPIGSVGEDWLAQLLHGLHAKVIQSGSSSPPFAAAIVAREVEILNARPAAGTTWRPQDAPIDVSAVRAYGLLFPADRSRFATHYPACLHLLIQYSPTKEESTHDDHQNHVPQPPPEHHRPAYLRLLMQPTSSRGATHDDHQDHVPEPPPDDRRPAHLHLLMQHSPITGDHP
jgi:hypothetical protein